MSIIVEVCDKNYRWMYQLQCLLGCCLHLSFACLYFLSLPGIAYVLCIWTFFSGKPAAKLRQYPAFKLGYEGGGGGGLGGDTLIRYTCSKNRQCLLSEEEGLIATECYETWTKVFYSGQSKKILTWSLELVDTSSWLKMQENMCKQLMIGEEGRAQVS